LSKGRISNILATTWSMKLKLKGLIVEDAEITKRWCVHTTTAIAPIIATKFKDIHGKISGNVETMLN